MWEATNNKFITEMKYFLQSKLKTIFLPLTEKHNWFGWNQVQWKKHDHTSNDADCEY